MKMRISGLILLVVLSGFFLSACGADSGGGQIDGDETGETEEESAIRLAQSIFQQKKEEGTDFSDGPCISDNLMEGWVADVAHDPREAVDNLPENQCPSYGETANHFVELDENGELIRAR